MKGYEKAKLIVRLNELKQAQKGKIIKIKARGETRNRIIEMGFTPGSLVELEHADLPGEPLEFKVKGYHVSLSKDEASKIIVEPL